MVECLIKEWTSLSDLYNIDHPVTIFFGGGTPSLLDSKYIEKIVTSIDRLSSVLEVSLEANPGDLHGKVSSLSSAGVTRLSVGIQALNDEELKFLNRDHNVIQAWNAIDQSLKYFPKSTSVDLIFGRPNQNWTRFRGELEQIIKSRVPHVSLYQLTVEKGTSLHKQVTSGQVTLPEEDTMAEMYNNAVALLDEAGLARYEVSNFSVPGAQCLHNIGYWSGNERIMIQGTLL